jgi:hypothetical protein
MKPEIQNCVILPPKMLEFLQHLVFNVFSQLDLSVL